MNRLVNLLRQGVLGSPSVATWAGFLARSLSLICLPPFVFHFFSPPEAALWFVLITLQGLQVLLEVGFHLAFIRAIGFAMGGATQVRDQRELDQNRNAGQPNNALLSRIWSAMRVLYWLVGLVTFLLISATAIWSAPVLIGQIEDTREGWGALVLFIIGAGLRAYGGLHISYLYGVGRISLLRWWEMLFWVLAFLGALGAILAGGGLIEVAVAYQAPLMINLAWNVVLARRDQACRAGFMRINRIDRDVIDQVWPGIWRGGLGVAIYTGVTQGAGLYYAQVGPPNEVAIYLFAMSLMRPMMQFAQVPFFTKLPHLAALQAAGDRVKQVAVAQRAMFMSQALLAGMVLAAAMVLPLLAWFVGGEAARVPLLLWAMIGLAAYLERVGGMHLQLYSQTNHILWHWANGITAVLFAIFAWFFLPHLGALAFPVGLCVAIVLFYMPYSMWHSYRAFKLPFPSFDLRTSAGPLLLVILLVAAGVVV